MITPFRNQQGAVLVVGLMMLVVLTLIAVTSMQSASLQTLMAQGSTDKALAFEAAEAALRAAASALDNGDFVPDQFEFDEGDGLLQNEYDAIWKEWNTADWQSKARTVSFPKVTSQPHYVIQRIATIVPTTDRLNIYQAYGEVSDAAETELFRITARGTGTSDNTVVYLESLHGARF